MQVLRLDQHTRMEIEDSGQCRLIAQRGLHYFDRDTNQFEDYVHRVDRDASVNNFTLRMKCEHWSRFGPGGRFRFGLATGKFLTCTPQDAVAVAPVAEGPVVTYNGVWTNTDLSYCVFPEGVKETIQLNTPAAPGQFAFGLCCNDVVLKPRVDGGFNIVSDGEAIGIIQPATAVDAAGVTVPVAQTVGQGALTMTIDPVWLANPARQWPVIIDPTITLQPNGTGIDTYVHEGAQGSNFGTNTNLIVGRVITTGYKVRTLIKLASSVLIYVTSHNYVSATMSLYVSGSKSITPDLCRITADWAELEVDWGDGTTFDSNTPGVSLGTTGWKDYDIKTFLGQWVDGLHPNYGLAIEYTGSTNNTLAELYSSDYGTPSLRPMFTLVFEYFPGVMLSPAGSAVAPTIISNQVHGFSLSGGLRHYITRDAVPATATKRFHIRDAAGVLIWDSGSVADVKALSLLYGVSYQASGYFYGQSYMGQNFVATQPYINGARLSLATELASVPADDITVELYAADGDGKPIGVALARGVIIRFASTGALVWKYVQLTPDVKGGADTNSPNADLASEPVNGHAVAAFATVAGGTWACGAITHPDRPRNTCITVYNDSGGPLNLFEGTMAFLVTGTLYGAVQTETITITSTAGNKAVATTKYRVMYGVKAFSTVTNITLNNVPADGLKIGAGLGLCPGCAPAALVVDAKYVLIMKAPNALVGNRYKYGYGVDSYSYNILSDNQADAEAGLAGFVWSAGTETLEWTTAQAWHGTHSIKVVTPGNVTIEGVMTSFVSMSAGVVRSGSLRAIGAGTIKITLQAYSDTVFLGESVPHVVVLSSSVWTHAKTENFLTPTGTTRIRLLAVTTGTPQAITFYIDGLQIVPAVAAPTWKMPISGVYSTDGGVTWTVYQDRDYQIEAAAPSIVLATVPSSYLHYGKLYKATVEGTDANAVPFSESTLGGCFICTRTTPAGPTDLAADDHLFVVGDDGKVWTIDEGTTDDGVVIAAEWVSGALTARQFIVESMARQLKLKRLWVVADVPTGATLGVRISTRARDLGDGADWSSPSTVTGAASPQRVKIPLPIDAGTLARTPWFRIKFSTLGPVHVVGIYPDVRLKK